MDSNFNAEGEAGFVLGPLRLNLTDFDNLNRSGPIKWTKRNRKYHVTKIVPRSWFEYGFWLSGYATHFFSCSKAWKRSSHWQWFDTGGCSAQQFRWLHENRCIHIQSFLDKALIEKPMLVQVRSSCTSKASGTALQEDFVIRKVGSKDLMMNILVAIHVD